MALNTIEAKLESALFSHIQAMTLPAQLPIVWPGLVYPIGSASKAPSYIRVQHSPNDPQRVFIGSTDPHRFSGFFVISLCTPLNQGSVGSRDTAGLIAAHFETDTEIAYEGATLRVTKHPNVAEGYPDAEEVRWRTPIIVDFEAWA